MRALFAEYLSPLELRRLLAGLMVVVGGLLLFVIFAFLVIPGGRNANRPQAQMPVTAAAGETGWLDPTEYPAARGYDVPPLEPQTVMTPSPEATARGQALFAQNCAACHGDGGTGNGPAAAGLDPRPRDLTAATGWKNGPGLSGLFRTLAVGLPGSAMTPYDFLSKRDRMALVHHVRSLGRFERPAEEAAALAALEKELAAPGERVPARIPVSVALARLAAEERGPAPLAVAATSPEILRRVVADPQRVARVLGAAPAPWRHGPQELAGFVVAGLPANGFRSGVVELSTEEWRTLLAALEPLVAGAQ